MDLKSHFINGEWHQGRGDSFTVSESKLGVIWTGSEASSYDVELAVKSARAALLNWASLKLADRINYLNRFGRILSEEKTVLAEVISESTGKPLWEAATEVESMIAKIPISIEAYHQRTGTVTRKEAIGCGTLRHRPHGVIAVLGPFNFPGHLPNGHIVPALLAGNTIVFKPSELTPKVAEIMVKYWELAQLPSGVLNLIQGGPACGKELLQADIDGVFFTGSYNTGCSIHRQFAGQPQKILALEMGGNNPLVVHDCSAISAAVYATILSAFISSGQRCTAARRLIVDDSSTGDEFLKQLVVASQKIKVGHYRDIPEPFMGPVISVKVAEFLLQQQDKFIAHGGKSLLEMKLLKANSAFVSPAIIELSDCHDKFDDEIFGPILQVYRSSNLEHAIWLANNTDYGLAAGIFCDNEQDYLDFEAQVRAGIINWNRPLTGASSRAPFGGIGKSGNHRPSAFYAADYCAYPVAGLETKNLCVPESLLPGIFL